MLDSPKFVCITQRTNWVDRWGTQDFSSAAEQHYVFPGNFYHNLTLENLEATADFVCKF